MWLFTNSGGTVTLQKSEGFAGLPAEGDQAGSGRVVREEAVNMRATIRRKWTAVAGAVLVSTLLGGLANAQSADAAAPVARVNPQGITLPEQFPAEGQLFDLLNATRVANGLKPVVRIPAFDNFAREWSTYMAGGGCVERDGAQLCHRENLAMIASAVSPRGWTRAGENVGTVPDGGSIEALHQAFLNSASHRANMLSPYFNAVGIGVHFDPNGRLFVTFEYIATVGEPNTTGPVTGFPAAPEGATQEEAFVFYVNFLRQQAGLQPLVRNSALDRESAYWSQFRANGGCESTGGACNRRDMPTVLKATLGTGRTRWWSAAVGMTYASDSSAQVAWFANSAAMRKMLLRKDANVIGVGLASDAEGITYMTLAIVQVKDLTKVRPHGTNTCGWIQPTLKVRSKGPYVRVAQCAMTEQGFWQSPADGVYTTTFAEAVKQFQTANNLRVTGTLDLKTRRALGVI